MKLWHHLKKHMLALPAQAVCEGEAEMTYEELVIWIENFTCRLKNIHSCAILCHSEMAAAMALLACFAADVTAVPLSMRYGLHHAKRILEGISPEAVITDHGGALTVVELSDSAYRVPDPPPALILCTSGTTGKPKGVMLSEENLLTNLSDIGEYFKITPSDTILIARPLFHSAVLTGEFLTALTKGCRIRFHSGEFNPAKMLELIEKHQITVFCGTPTLLGMMARRGRSGKCPLRHIGISGECMGRETGQKIAAAFPDCAIYHLYGQTEASPRIAYLPPRLFSEFPDCVGLPLRSVTLRLLNDNGEPCAVGEEGSVFVKGKNVMLGYYQDPDLTARVLKDGWLATGDIGLLNERGLLKIKGRRDDLIIKAGMNIYPAEIEATLKQDPRIKDALAYGFDRGFGTQIGLKLVCDLTEQEARALCRASLPDYQHPAKLEILPELPKNGAGKKKRTPC